MPSLSHVVRRHEVQAATQDLNMNHVEENHDVSKAQGAQKRRVVRMSHVALPPYRSAT